MAPVGMVDMLGWFSSPEAGVISLVVFLVLSVALVGLCVSCQRSSGNAYDVSGPTTGGGGANDGVAYSNWRDHNMPPATLERPHAATK